MEKHKEGSALVAITQLKCPKCNAANLYEKPILSFSKPFDMYPKCPNCNLDNFPEPGFYYGSMFISYIWTGFFAVGVLAIFRWVLKFELLTSMLILIGIMAVLYVWIFRVSRAMWLAMMYKKYDN